MGRTKAMEMLTRKDRKKKGGEKAVKEAKEGRGEKERRREKKGRAEERLRKGVGGEQATEGG